VSDRRVLLGVILGVSGFVLGVLGVLFDSTVPGVLAGLAAAGAGWVCHHPVRLAASIERPVAPAQPVVPSPEPVEAPADEHPVEAVETGDVDPSGIDPRTIAEIRSLGGRFEGAVDDTLTDPLTGLLDDRYFRVAMEARISAARRHLRPVAVVLVEVVQGLSEGTVRPADPTVVAAGIAQTLREADTACRLADGRFGLLLEDTPENGAVWTVERLRRTLAPEHPAYTMWAGVACYPAHAFTAAELHDRSTQALDAAREWRQDRIEVATAD
jgi:GGDEF domain-containing protein